MKSQLKQKDKSTIKTLTHTPTGVSKMNEPKTILRKSLAAYPRKAVSGEALSI